MKNKKNIIGALALIIIGGLLIGMLIISKKNSIEYKAYNTFLEYLQTSKIEEVILSENQTMKFKLINDENMYYTENPRNPQLKETLLINGITVSENTDKTTTDIAQLVMSIIFFGLAFYFVSAKTGKNSMKSAMALNITNANESKIHVLNFGDVAGNEEAKENVSDLVDFLKNPKKYSDYGARMPRGILFYGPPGTGKTLLAKAMAGEAGVAFYAVSGSDFVQMFVGVGAARIRDLFKKAREAGKAIIFIDEIDALGKKRSQFVSGGNDERDQTLNALLTEMSGFSSEEGIIVIGATNRLDTLDEALLRPGRFDRQVEIGLPDISARERILVLHAQGKPLNKDINMRKLATDTVFFSGAMLENLLNEAAISAAKEGLSVIEQKDIDKAYYTIVAGSEKKDRSNIKESDKQITAWHEAGHALMAKLTSPDNIVSKITIIPSTKGAGGFCVNIPPDKMYYTKLELESQIMISLAGRAAEELTFGSDNITTGAFNDIEKATNIATDYISKYGMSNKTGIINVSAFKNLNIAEECGSLLARLYESTKKKLSDNFDILNDIAYALLDKETLNREDLDIIIACRQDLLA